MTMMTKILSDKYPLLLILHLAHSVTWSRVYVHITKVSSVTKGAALKFLIFFSKKK